MRGAGGCFDSIEISFFHPLPNPRRGRAGWGGNLMICCIFKKIAQNIKHINIPKYNTPILGEKVRPLHNRCFSHCEEWSDEAISWIINVLWDCFASLAMTILVFCKGLSSIGFRLPVQALVCVRARTGRRQTGGNDRKIVFLFRR